MGSKSWRYVARVEERNGDRDLGFIEQAVLGRGVWTNQVFNDLLGRIIHCDLVKRNARKDMELERSSAKIEKDQNVQAPKMDL